MRGAAAGVTDWQKNRILYDQMPPLSRDPVPFPLLLCCTGGFERRVGSLIPRAVMLIITLVQSWCQ